MHATPALLLLALPRPLPASELQWAGHYRARALVYDSLSLSDTNPQAEGTSSLVDHRLRLRPRWILSERVALFAQVDALDLVPWGAEPEAWVDPVTGDPTDLAFDQSLVAPTDEDGALLSDSLSVSRAWAEVYTDVGRFRFGRVPLSWGTGIFLNDGLALDAEYGDTADRVQFTTRVGELYLMAAWDARYEGYANQADDMMAVNAAVAYLGELASVGFYNRYLFQPSQDFGSWAGDLWFEATLGAVKAEGETVAVFGGGNLDQGANDVQLSAVGAVLRLSFRSDPLSGGLEGGLATGDADPDDSTIKTFTFDRDHNVALLLFEEPLPTLAAANANETNQGRDYGAVLTGEGVRNALYLRPHLGYELLSGLVVDEAVLLARAAKLPEERQGQESYGVESDLSVNYAPYPHVQLRGTFAVLWPGPYFSEYEDEELGGGFDKPALGGLLLGAVTF